jgi:hypothetical protein
MSRRYWYGLAARVVFLWVPYSYFIYRGGL